MKVNVASFAAENFRQQLQRYRPTLTNSYQFTGLSFARSFRCANRRLRPPGSFIDLPTPAPPMALSEPTARTANRAAQTSTPDFFLRSHRLRQMCQTSSASPFRTPFPPQQLQNKNPKYQPSPNRPSFISLNSADVHPTVDRLKTILGGSGKVDYFGLVLELLRREWVRNGEAERFDPH